MKLNLNVNVYVKVKALKHLLEVFNARTKNAFPWVGVHTLPQKFQTVIEYLKKIYALTLFELPSFHTVTASQTYLSYVKFTLNYN